MKNHPKPVSVQTPKRQTFWYAICFNRQPLMLKYHHIQAKLQDIASKATQDPHGILYQGILY